MEVRSLPHLSAVLAAAGALCCLALAPTAGAAVVDPALGAQIDSSPSGRVSALVMFRAQPRGDGAAVARRRDAERISRRDSDALGRVSGRAPRRYWLANAAVVTLDRAGLARVARMPQVRSVGPTRSAIRLVPAAGVPTVSADESWALTAIGASVANGRGYTGAGVRVGVIDTGIDVRNPAFSGTRVIFRDFMEGRSVPYDDGNHGTAVASAIAGQGLGSAPGAELLVAKALNARGVDAEALLGAAQWMCDPDGDPSTADQPAVVNNSWASATPNQPWIRAIVTGWRNCGILPVFAAGNWGPQPIGSPGDYPESFTVGALSRELTPSAFSSRGPAIWSADPASTAAGKPDLSAPGEGILGASGASDLGLWMGTSMAAPLVSGVAALLAEARPDLGPEQIADILRASALAISDRDGAGAGMVRAPEALDLALGQEAVPAAVSLRTPLPARTRATILSLRLSLSGGARYRVSVDGVALGGVRQASALTVPLRHGLRTITVATLDYRGARTGQEHTHRLLVDRIRPRLAVRITRLAGGRARLVLRVRDQGAGVAGRDITWRFKGRTLRGARARVVTVRTPTTVLIRARDRAGNPAHLRVRLRPA